MYVAFSESVSNTKEEEKKKHKEKNNLRAPCFFLIIRGRWIDLKSGNINTNLSTGVSIPA